MKNRNLKQDDIWRTPPKYYDKWNKEFDFDFDPCPYNEDPITPENDGLLKEWGQRNFINPPYSPKLKEAFVKKAVQEASKGKLCVCLLPVSTSTKLFHDIINTHAKEIRFLKGRIKFQKRKLDGSFYVPKNGGMHDSMLVIFNGGMGIKQQELFNEM